MVFLAVFVPIAIGSESLLVCSPDMSLPHKHTIVRLALFLPVAV